MDGVIGNMILAAVIADDRYLYALSFAALRHSLRRKATRSRLTMEASLIRSLEVLS